MELTSQPSYQEYKIKAVAVDLIVYEYACCPNEPWPIAKYVVTLKRTTGFYYTMIIGPGIIVTLLSFAVFWTDTNSADALGYGITVIVVNLLGNLVLVNMLPMCGELLWIDIFSALNTGFCCIALFQSAFNIMLENKTDDHLLPLWMVVPVAWLQKQLPTAEGGVHKAILNSGPDSAVPVDYESLLNSASTLTESVAGILYRQQMRTTGRTPNGLLDEHARKARLAARSATTPEERARKMIGFESLFFTLDADSSLFIDNNECEALLSYAVPELDPNQRGRLMREYDKDHNGRLSRIEFCRMCVDELWDVPSDIIDTSVANMRLAISARTTRNKAYWSQVADQCDTWARITIPALYFLALFVVFNLELTDDYSSSNGVMFEGLGPAETPPVGRVWIAGYCAILAGLVIAWAVVRRISVLKHQKTQDQIREAGRRIAAVPDRAPSAASAPATSRMTIRRHTMQGIGKSNADLWSAAAADGFSASATPFQNGLLAKPAACDANGGVEVAVVTARVASGPRSDTDGTAPAHAVPVHVDYDAAKTLGSRSATNRL